MATPDAQGQVTLDASVERMAHATRQARTVVEGSAVFIGYGLDARFPGSGGLAMKIEYLHASVYGNGAIVAAEFKKQMAAGGVVVDVHHIREVSPTEVPPADLYLFSSPGRMGKPIGGMRRFLRKVTLPAGTRYAILTTEAAPKPDKTTGRIPTEEELAKWQRVRPIMNEILHSRGLVKVAEDKVFVTALKGPLEEEWQEKVRGFVTQIPVSIADDVGARANARREASAA